MTRVRNKGLTCSVSGCGQPARKRGWCGSHYAQQRYTGRPPEPFKHKWAPAGPCVVCGAPNGYGRRRFCSNACRVLHATYKGDVPSVVQCVACGIDIDLTERGKGGQRRKVVTKFCGPCRQDYRKYKLSARELANRDGTDCGICGEPVDMSLRRKDSNMCASVDHIIPRSLGGTHDPDNLQLSHLYCNQVKSDRWAGDRP
jgi:5-methylcytosine-specific restriction endonuclease McrA